MSKLLRNIRQLAVNRDMRPAYSRWILTMTLLRRPPSITLSENVRIGEWLDFSEYWSLRNALPVSERTFIHRCLGTTPEHSVAFDVGANIGIFACFMAGIGAREVHCFEPVPETFCRLKRNVIANRLLHRCVLNCLAVGTRDELLTFEIRSKSPATNRLAPSAANVSVLDVATLQHVAATSIDSYCRVFRIERIDFMKVDVEGMETQVLKGGEHMLSQKRIMAILLEACPRNLVAAGSSASALYKQVALSGYGAYHLSATGNVGEAATLNDIESTPLENIILLPK